MKIYYSNSTKQTEEIAASFACELKNGDVIAFKGGLGAGKTAFTRGLAIGLGLNSEVTSPTFALVHEYRNADTALFHFDMYRICNLDDLYSTGYFDYLDENKIIAIEWSENIEQALEKNTIFIMLEVLDENKRKITIDGGDRF